jgi:hypothetical protein
VPPGGRHGLARGEAGRVVETYARLGTRGVRDAAASRDMNVGGEAADVKREVGVDRGFPARAPQVRRRNTASLGLTTSGDDPKGMT